MTSTKKSKAFTRTVPIAIALLLCMTFTGIASADGTSEAAYVTVTNISIDPGVLMQGDTATITITVKNQGTANVPISRAELYTDDFSVKNENTYNSVGTLASGNTMTFSFTIEANGKDGVYYPTFYLDFRDGGSLRYQIPIKVDNTPLVVSALNIPDAFEVDQTENIHLSVGNPRENTVNGVTVIPVGDDFDSSQTSRFVGALSSDASEELTFEVTPTEEESIVFAVEYRNGINKHTTLLSIPVTFGDKKIQAEPVINNLEIAGSAGGYTVTGDVTNAGLEDALSVIVTIGSPGEPEDPNPLYVIGALEPDDFSSFEVTFSAPGATVPLIVQYKDEDGNVYDETFDLTLSGSGSASASASSGTVSDGASQPARKSGGPGGMMNFGSGMSSIPVFEILGVIIIGGGVIILWRKGYLTRKKFDALVQKLRGHSK